MSVDVVATAIGGREMSQAIRDSGALLGFETAQTRPPGNIEFCDFPFTDESATFADHLEVVEREQPTIAVAPDIDDGRDPFEVFDQADELAEHAETVVVVPKSIHPAEVPARFRVGVPLANFGDEIPHQWDDYQDAAELHLLGGSPTAQLEFGRYLDNVRSVDGASVAKGAQMGDVWCPSRERNWHPTGNHQLGYYERVQTSLSNVVEAWRVHRTNEAGAYREPFEAGEWNANVRPKVDRVDTREGYHRHGARGAAPSIDPRDADCMTSDELAGFEIVDWRAERARAERRGIEAMQDEAEQVGLDRFASDGSGSITPETDPKPSASSPAAD